MSVVWEAGFHFSWVRRDLAPISPIEGFFFFFSVLRNSFGFLVDLRRIRVFM